MLPPFCLEAASSGQGRWDIPEPPEVSLLPGHLCLLALSPHLHIPPCIPALWDYLLNSGELLSQPLLSGKPKQRMEQVQQYNCSLMQLLSQGPRGLQRCLSLEQKASVICPSFTPLLSSGKVSLVPKVENLTQHHGGGAAGDLDMNLGYHRCYKSHPHLEAWEIRHQNYVGRNG